MYTAYVTSGTIYAICERIQKTHGMFGPANLLRFNTMTEGKFEAVEILSHHAASFGHVYRIEYCRDGPMRCS